MLACGQSHGEKFSRASGSCFLGKCNGLEVTLELSLEGGEGESRADESTVSLWRWGATDGSWGADCCGWAVTRGVGGMWVLSGVTLTWRRTLPCRRANLVLGSVGDGVHPKRGSRGASQRKRYRSEIRQVGTWWRMVSSTDLGTSSRGVGTFYGLLPIWGQSWMGRAGWKAGHS